MPALVSEGGLPEPTTGGLIVGPAGDLLQILKRHSDSGLRKMMSYYAAHMRHAFGLLLLSVLVASACTGTVGEGSPSLSGETSVDATTTTLRNGSQSGRPACHRGRLTGRNSGLHRQDIFPPRPYFEMFNGWQAASPTDCVVIAAGQQQIYTGDGGPLKYRQRGALFIRGDDRTPNQIDLLYSPLLRPIRIVAASGYGYATRLVLQSLRNCSVVTFLLRTSEFEPIPGGTGAVDAYSCPAREQD